jgi:hypothetical protein
VFAIAWLQPAARRAYDLSIPLLIAVSVLTELDALIPFAMATLLTRS